MVIFIFICIVVLGAVAAFRLLAPEMYVPVGKPRFHFPWSRPHLHVVPETPEARRSEQKAEALPTAIDMPLHAEEIPMPAGERLNKMETLLLEKNTQIDKLQKYLEAERSHRSEFEKVKSVLDEEIARLKEQIKVLKKKE